MAFADELRPPVRRSDIFQASGGDASFECDWCGSAVRREVAHQRVERTDDGLRIVVLCPACDGAD
jgi:hypothetical protein